MGLFSSKKKTYVGTTVSRVIENNLLPDSIKTGGLTALVKEGDSLDYIRDELLQGIGMRAESMYRYAKNNYTNGMPSGQYLSNDIGEVEVDAVLTGIEGLPVTIEYSRLGSPNGLHIGWMNLISSHGYDPLTNILGNLSITKGVNVYLDDMVYAVPTADYSKYSASTLAQWGTAANAGYTPSKISVALKDLVQPSPMVLDALAIEDHVKVTYVWKATPTSALSRDTFTIPITGYDDSAEYLHVKYLSNGITKYWMYAIGAGTHASLDNLLDTPVVQGTYFPFIYFRYNKAPVSTDVNNMEYKTSKKALKYLGIDYDDMIDGINQNQDIGDVQQAMLLMAVPAVTTEPIEQRYLFDYFDNIYEANQKQFPVQDKINAFNRNLNRNANAYVIQDNKFKMSLSFSAIYKTRIAGTFPAEVSGQGTETYTVKVEKYQNEGDTFYEDQIKTIKYHFYRRKITNNLYDEIKVSDLQVTYYVLGDYTVIADETDNILLIPIDRSVSKLYNIMDREVLYSRSLHYVFNSVQIVKIKWYQQGWFSALLKIAAIVVTIISFGADGGALFTAVSSLSLAAIGAAIWSIMVDAFIGLIIGELFKIFVQAIGMDAAIILAVIGAAYGIYTKMANVNMQQFLWGDNLLKMATGLMSGVQATATSLIEDLMKEASEFTKFVEEQTKILDDAKELLHNRVLLSPFVIFGETPKEYYDRTVHSGNIGVVGINAVGKYVETALTLPKLRDTLGENNYG